MSEYDSKHQYECNINVRFKRDYEEKENTYSITLQLPDPRNEKETKELQIIRSTSDDLKFRLANDLFDYLNSPRDTIAYWKYRDGDVMERVRALEDSIKRFQDKIDYAMNDVDSYKLSIEDCEKVKQNLIDELAAAKE